MGAGQRDRVCPQFALESRAVLVTLPLGVLQAGDVVFDPPLPSSKIEAIHALQAGKAFKMVTSFRPCTAASRSGPKEWPFSRALSTPNCTGRRL